MDDGTLIRRYLLGNVTEDERRRVEERLLADDDYFNHLCRLEADLVDEYVRGALAADDRLRFERHFLVAPDHRESLAFAQVLKASLATRASAPVEGPAAKLPSNPPANRLLRRSQSPDPGSRVSNRALYWRSPVAWISIFLVVTLALAAALLLIKTTELRKRMAQIQLDRAEFESVKEQLADQVARNKTLAEELERRQLESPPKAQEPVDNQRPTADPGGLGLVSLALNPGRTRDGGRSSTVILTPRTRQVRLRLALGDSRFAGYKAEVQNAEFKTILFFDKLKPGAPGGGTVVITIPAQLLTRSDYLVRLSGVSSDGDQRIVHTYFFAVARK